MLKRLFFVIRHKNTELKRNYTLLRQEVDKLGKIYEKQSYQDLLNLGQITETIILMNQHKLYFSGEVYEIKQDGILCFCLDADGLPTWLGIKPSYHFYKQTDNSVFY